MTLTQLIAISGLNISRKEAGKIGKKIKILAISQKVNTAYVDEVVKVNDYPESFIEQMQSVLIDHLTSKK